MSFAAGAARAGDVHYLACRADNESADSLFGIDEAAKRVCDRQAGSRWIKPMAFDAALIQWSDGASTKAIYRKGRHKHYEHNYLLLNHIGHCNKAAAPAAPLCTG